jgi:two-component system sensor histidine kinase HydH
MKRDYKRIKVVGLRKKSSSQGTQNTINGAQLRLEASRDPRHWARSNHDPQESERLALLGTMAVVLAHEIGNPLAGILLALECVEGHLKKHAANDPSLMSLIQSAMRETDRLTLLLREFGSLTPIQALNFKWADLAMIIKEALALEMLVYQDSGITVKFDFEDALPQIRLDSAKIKQVILNLCKNAIEAMPDGGCLTLKAYYSGRMVVLEISDTGVGIPSGISIFELFTTTKAHGTGLGLPVARQIVSAHGGTIACQIVPHGGARFTVSLPISEPKAMVETRHLHTLT